MLAKCIALEFPESKLFLIEESLPAEVRYAPMRHLLSNDVDKMYIRALMGSRVPAKRREFRARYLDYLLLLRQEADELHSLRILAMKAEGRWDAGEMFSHKLLLRCTLFQLRWFAVKHWWGRSIDPAVVEELITWILAGPIPRPEIS